MLLNGGRHVSNNPRVPETAQHRITAFSRVVWIFGGIVAVVVALTSVDRIGWEPGRGLVDLRDSGTYGNYPWDQPNVPIIERDDETETWRGTGNGVIHFDDYNHEDPPLVVTMVEGEERAQISFTESGVPQAGLPVDERDWPTSAGSVRADEPVFVPPVDGTVEIWVASNDDWALSIEPGEAQKIDDFAAGTGNAWLAYRGEALSGRFIHRGEGVFFVTLYTENGRESLIIDSGEVNLRASWDPSPWVYIEIESDADRGVWTVDLDNVDPSDSPTPPPSAPPSPGPQGEQ